MRIQTAIVAASLTLLPLTACSNGQDSKPRSSTPATATASPAATPSPSPSTSPPASALAFGQSVATKPGKDGTTATATVLSYQQGGFKTQSSPDDEQGTSGYVWAALELSVCSTKGTIDISRFPWVLAYADGSRIEPSGTTFGDFPKPEYPFEAKVKEGDCVRGKSVYAVPGSKRPAKVIYTTKLLNEPAEWTVPAA